MDLTPLSHKLEVLSAAITALTSAQTASSSGVSKGLEQHDAKLVELQVAIGELRKGVETGTAAAAAAASAAKIAPAVAAPVAAAKAAVVPRLAYDAIRGSTAAEGAGVDAAAGGFTRPCIVGTYDNDFATVSGLLRDGSGPGFAFVRYADGELGVAQGRDIGNEEWHFSPGQASVMQRDLLDSLKGHYGQRYWYAFASPLDDADGLRFYLERTEQACGFVSYANMWVNSHYPHTQGLLKELTEGVYKGRSVLVVNEESVGKVRAAGGLGGGASSWAVGALPLKDNLVTEWEKEDVRGRIKADAEALAAAHSGRLFLVSGGPVGKVIIAWMWAANPSNKYVDFGSTLDPFLRGKHTRAYHNPNHQHAAQVDPSWVIGADGRPTNFQ